MEEHYYEKTQNFNMVTRFLHKVRYKNLEKIVSKIKPKYGRLLRVLDIGCGVAKSYNFLFTNFGEISYIGVELNKEYVDIAKARYSKNSNFKIVCDRIENQLSIINNFDLIIGLESFEHIPEKSVVRIIEAISISEFQYLYLTVPNEIGPSILIKNVGSMLMGYKRYKEYTWRETLYASICELDSVGRHTINHKGFDWRWLAQTLRQNITIIKKTTSPFNFIPKVLSPSIGFICTK